MSEHSYYTYPESCPNKSNDLIFSVNDKDKIIIYLMIKLYSFKSYHHDKIYSPFDEVCGINADIFQPNLNTDESNLYTFFEIMDVIEKQQLSLNDIITEGLKGVNYCATKCEEEYYLHFTETTSINMAYYKSTGVIINKNFKIEIGENSPVEFDGDTRTDNLMLQCLEHKRTFFKNLVVLTPDEILEFINPNNYVVLSRGNYGTVYKYKDILLKQIHNKEWFERIQKTKLITLSTSYLMFNAEREIDHVIERYYDSKNNKIDNENVFRQSLIKIIKDVLQYSYIKQPKNKLNILLLWTFIHEQGWFHGDVKPGNIVNNTLIDLDNLEFQRIGKINWCSSDSMFYNKKLDPVTNDLINLFNYVIIDYPNINLIKGVAIKYKFGTGELILQFKFVGDKLQVEVKSGNNYHKKLIRVDTEERLCFKRDKCCF
jgi:hypothetical protein